MIKVVSFLIQHYVYSYLGLGTDSITPKRHIIKFSHQNFRNGESSAPQTQMSIHPNILVSTNVYIYLLNDYTHLPADTKQTSFSLDDFII